MDKNIKVKTEAMYVHRSEEAESVEESGNVKLIMRDQPSLQSMSEDRDESGESRSSDPSGPAGCSDKRNQKIDRKKQLPATDKALRVKTKASFSP